MKRSRILKSLLGLIKLMNKRQVYMEKMLTILLLTFTIGLLVSKRSAISCMANPSQKIDRYPIRNVSLVPQCSSKVKNGNAIPVYSFYSDRNGRSLSNRKISSCRQLLTPSLPWFSRMSELKSDPQDDLDLRVQVLY